MGNLGITLAEQTAKYVKACGKRSILETKPVGKIVASELGVCLPEGIISFQTEKAAQNYARNICMKQGLLPMSEQFEVAVLRKNNRILGVINGNKTTVNLTDLVKKHLDKDDLVIEHYHPDIFGKGKTNPLSFGADTRCLICPNIQSIIAYNSLGQYNKLEKLPSFNRMAIQEVLDDTERDILEKLVATEKDLVMRAFYRNGLADKSWVIDVSSGKYIERPTTNFKVSEKTRNKINTAMSELFKKRCEFKRSKEYPQIAHKILKENSEKCGLKYSTNMDFQC